MCSQNLSSWKFVEWCGSRESSEECRVDSDRRYIGNSVKMLSDDSTTSISAITSTFAARRRSGRIITMLPKASVGGMATNNFEALRRRGEYASQSSSEQS